MVPCPGPGMQQPWTGAHRKGTLGEHAGGAHQERGEDTEGQHVYFWELSVPFPASPPGFWGGRGMTDVGR